MSWDIEKSKELYGINFWGKPFFNINDKGNISVNPQGPNGPSLDLHTLVNDLKERGVNSPLLLQFPDIIKARVKLIADCFSNAIEEHGYKGQYRGVYPIKVNQQRHLVDKIISSGKNSHLGLECGSKPELLVALALMTTEDAIIVCNGFKDIEYIETALLAQKIGKKTMIVVDRMDELPMIIQASQKFNVRPNIGFRTKLNAQGAGKWVDSSGHKSKFGLTSSEMVRGMNMLREVGMEDSLELLHFHIGSQIPSIQPLKTSLKEAARVYTEIYKMGFQIKYLDVGGGLGVDYDASSGKSFHSTNYTEQEYANDVINTVQSICDENSVPHPHIITESGRALVAHSSLLVFDILGRNQVTNTIDHVNVTEKDHRLVKDLYESYQYLDKSTIRESYNDLIEKKRDIRNMFSYGVLGLEDRAKAEDIYWAICSKLVKLAKDVEDADDFFWDLEKELSDIYFCNFSIFQSLPDSWALDQVFPMMPVHRLNEVPDHRATIVDLTCDSDGKIERFIDADDDDIQSYLEVHDLIPEEKYYLAAFLTGAYQEILGDMHNLFGDTNAVYVSINEHGYSIDHVIEGDSVEEVLKYVEYEKPMLVESIRQASEKGIREGMLTHQDAKALMKYYQQSLSGYTYLEDPED